MVERLLLKICFSVLVSLGNAVIIFANNQDTESSNPMLDKVDVLNYNLEIWLEPPLTSFRGKEVLQFKFLKPTRHIVLHLEDLIIDTIYSSAGKVNYHYNGKIIQVQFEKKTNKNKKLDLTISYHGHPTDGLIIKNPNNGLSAFSDNWPNRARNWFPSIDHPSDKATFTSKVHILKEYEVIGNGYKVSEHLEGNSKIVVYHIDQPIATYCMVIGVSHFAITSAKSVENIPVHYYTYPADSAVAMHHFRRVPDMLHFYDSLIGPYPYSQLALVQSSTRFGGMENSSAIFLADQGSIYQKDTDSEETLAHEIAHQWFGDAVTQLSWSELWLSEGFATYFSALYFESRDGQIKFDTILQKTKDYYLRHSPLQMPVVWEYPRLIQLLNTENYQKGALFLHALRLRVGTPIFFKAIGKYYAAFKNKNATTADFKAIMESACHQNLGGIFTQWLDSPGLPRE